MKKRFNFIIIIILFLLSCNSEKHDIEIIPEYDSAAKEFRLTYKNHSDVNYYLLPPLIRVENITDSFVSYIDTLYPHINIKKVIGNLNETINDSLVYYYFKDILHEGVLQANENIDSLFTKYKEYFASLLEKQSLKFSKQDSLHYNNFIPLLLRGETKVYVYKFENIYTHKSYMVKIFYEGIDKHSGKKKAKYQKLFNNFYSIHANVGGFKPYTTEIKDIKFRFEIP